MQDDNFNFIGINTIGCFDNREHFIECDKVILEFSCTDGQEEELIRKLKATGFVVSAEAVPRSEGSCIDHIIIEYRYYVYTM